MEFEPPFFLRNYFFKAQPWGLLRLSLGEKIKQNTKSGPTPYRVSDR